MNEKSKEHARNVTDQVLELMRTGQAPWQQPLGVGETRVVLTRDENVGREKAHAAAAAIKGKVILPYFKENEVAAGMTDWNDLATSRGAASATKTINAAIDKVLPSRQKESAGMEMA